MSRRQLHTVLRSRGLHATRTLAHPRIMAADRVPGVKMTSGSPTRQEVKAEAARGANALAMAVARQKAQREAERAEAMAISKMKADTDTKTGSLASMHAALEGTIDGQPLAKDVVARALRRRSMRLDDSERPLRMLFAGPSGVGKTVMATALCEALLGSCVPDRNFKRFNLSEFSHPSKFNRLTGGDPNYVGYKEGGELTNFIRNAEERRLKRATGVEHTSCVLLLDEVDRAAEGLLTFLMNFLDQGQLTSGAGDTVDARRAVVLMTTNVGDAAIAAMGRAGASTMTWSTREEADSRRRQIVDGVKVDVLQKICDGRYENLGRLGTIVPFVPLHEAGRRSIVERQLDDISGRLRETGALAALDGWSDALVDHALTHWDDDVGGRSTRDFIEENVVEAIAETLDDLMSLDPTLTSSSTRKAGSPPLRLTLDVEATGDDMALARVVCRTATSASNHTFPNAKLDVVHSSGKPSDRASSPPPMSVSTDADDDEWNW
jgi:ATP-dependent Clp protease ATP-binding subunit ClpA